MTTRSVRAACEPTAVASSLRICSRSRRGDESKGEWDLYKLVSTTAPADVLHPLNAKCNFPTG